MNIETTEQRKQDQTLYYILTMEDQLIIKVCGMREPENIRAVEALDINWMGFIFYEPSSRFVGTRPSYLPERCKRVGVFVNSTEEEIFQKTSEYGLNMVQIHGDEKPSFCSHIRSFLPKNVELIKMVSISSEADMKKTAFFAPYVDYFLFESPCKGYGGSGQKFDWSLLELYEGDVPFILTGGIGPADAEELQTLLHPRFAGIDLNSRFEESPGIKKPELLRTFINKIRTT